MNINVLITDIEMVNKVTRNDRLLYKRRVITIESTNKCEMK